MIISNRNEVEVYPALWLEIFIFISSYYPLFLILFIKDIGNNEENIPIFLLEYGLHVSPVAIILFLISSIALLVIFSFMRRNLNHQQGGTEVKVLKVDPVKGDMINYNLPFLIGLFAFDYKTWQSILSLIIFLIFIFLFTRKDSLTFLNPMFLLMDIGLYKIEYREVGGKVMKTSTVLCLGRPVASDEIICLKEVVGVYFIFFRRSKEF